MYHLQYGDDRGVRKDFQFFLFFLPVRDFPVQNTWKDRKGKISCRVQTVSGGLLTRKRFFFKISPRKVLPGTEQIERQKIGGDNAGRAELNVNFHISSISCQVCIFSGFTGGNQ